MTDKITDAATDDYEQRTGDLAAIAGEYPGWFAWPGVLPPLLYARRSHSSPPLVVRSATEDGLREAIEDAERSRGRRD